MNTTITTQLLRLFLGLVCLSFPLQGVAQSDLTAPMLLDKATLSGVGLDTIKLKNEPERGFYQRNLYRGEDLSVYVVSSQSWVGKMDNFSIDEFIYLYHGKALVRPEEGGEAIFHTGDFFFVHKGYTGEWEISAGPTNHYELSVITTARATPPESPKLPAPIMLDKDKISGIDITFDENGLYEEILQEGIELTISVQAETPRTKKIENGTEQLICLLSGQLTFMAEGGEPTKYYSGDFILFPKGINGEWTSEGHGLVKYISVQKS
ncbi:MAG: cupin domain-containing protein [Bacteroidota bacterium]